MDEVLRAYLCQFTCINTLAALPSLGFYLRLITLYLLTPCRNMLFFPPPALVMRSWIQKCSPLLQLSGALAALSFQHEIAKNVKTISTRLLLQVGIHMLSHQAPRCAAGKWALLGLDLSLACTVHQVFKFTIFHKH